MKTKKPRIPSYKSFLKELREKVAEGKPLYRRDILLIILYNKEALYRCFPLTKRYYSYRDLVVSCKQTGLCAAFVIVLTYIFKGGTICYNEIVKIFPLFTLENAGSFSTYENRSYNGYWFAFGDWKTSGREAFLIWLIQQYIDDTEDIKDLVLSNTTFYTINTIFPC